MLTPSSCSGVYVPKKSWRRCDILNGLRGDDRLKTLDRNGDVYKDGHAFQRNFTERLIITNEDQAARVINTKKLIIVETLPIKPKKMTTIRDLGYWFRKGMYARDIPIRVNKTSWRRCNRLNGLRGGDRIETKLYAQNTDGRDYVYERFFIKVHCPQLRITQDDAYIIEAY
jgi:hypothetical protein